MGLHDPLWNTSCVKVACHIPLESFQRGLQLYFKCHLNWRSAHKSMSPQSHESPNLGNFGTPTWESREKCHLNVSLVASHILCYKGEGGGFPQIRAMVSLVSPSLPKVCRNPTLRQVWGWDSHSQKVRTWSPPGLLKTQSSIVKVKTPRLKVLFISFERSWSVDVENGLACAILTSATQVMVERKARSQTGSLTPDH
jgi:hypothetical protein